MRAKNKRLLTGLVAVGIVALAVVLLRGHTFAVLAPRGTIAAQQRGLMIAASVLMLVVVIPVFALTFGIAWRYRASNEKAKYTPEWDHNIVAETIWWAIPMVLITFLSIITWQSSHRLDPFRPIASTVKPLKIQVVALQWKWLFLYPDQGIASVNYVQFPKDRPVDFEITSDAPMNSFWIPQLGGQIYAMSGMSTHLNLMASQTGMYQGSSANLSGDGFSGMKFKAEATTNDNFANWVSGVKQGTTQLSNFEYDKLARPSKDVQPMYYASKDSDIYDRVLAKYMDPSDLKMEMQHE
ncbi:MAG: Ubiquinol oxidase subunit 2 [Candidatus Saccharibacteria bacterium]|nr:Ubiquinol oxidase subunit 2 [Candidatus Saccharibacteria bacterium]